MFRALHLLDRGTRTREELLHREHHRGGRRREGDDADHAGLLVRDHEREREHAGREVVRDDPAETPGEHLARVALLRDAHRGDEQPDVDDEEDDRRAERSGQSRDERSAVLHRLVSRGACAGGKRPL